MADQTINTGNNFRYKEADLEYIYIRVERDGKWTNASLNDLTDEEFVAWATEKFGVEIKDDINAIGTPWTKLQKKDFLNEMNSRAGKPVVAMIKEEARHQFEEGKNNQA